MQLTYFISIPDIAILAKLKHIPFPVVAKRLLAVDDKLFTENLLRNLQANVPTPEEMGKLSVFVSSASEEDLELLSRPDTFCYEVDIHSAWLVGCWIACLLMVPDR